MTKFERYAKYEVMKLDDIDEFLSTAHRYYLADIVHSIQDGRRKQGKKPCNSYVVVNEDEPYANKVWDLIKESYSGKI